MHDDSQLLRLADENLAEAQRQQARWQPGYRIEETLDVLMVASATRLPAGPFNSLLTLGACSVEPNEIIARARAHYAALDRGFTIYTRSHADQALARQCQELGYVRFTDTPGMVLLESPAPPRLAPGIEICAVRSATQAAHFSDVAAAAYESIGLAPSVTRRMLSAPPRWLPPHWHVEVLYEAEQPVCGAMLLLSHGIAGIYWVGTVPSARGRGHADAVMRSISRWGFTHGAAAVILQASPFGEPVYKRIGYRELTRYVSYLVPRHSAG